MQKLLTVITGIYVGLIKNKFAASILQSSNIVNFYRSQAPWQTSTERRPRPSEMTTYFMGTSAGKLMEVLLLHGRSEWGKAIRLLNELMSTVAVQIVDVLRISHLRKPKFVTLQLTPK